MFLSNLQKDTYQSINFITVLFNNALVIRRTVLAVHVLTLLTHFNTPVEGPFSLIRQIH